MSITVKEGVALIDRITKKCGVGHIAGPHVLAFLEEIDAAVERAAAGRETSPKTRTVTVKVVFDDDTAYAEVLRVPCVGERFVFEDGTNEFVVQRVAHYSAEKDERRAGVVIHIGMDTP